jgi:hypothetical protein
MNRQRTGLNPQESAVRRGGPTTPRADAKSFLRRSTQKVIAHYFHLLSTHSLSESERHAILLRLEKHERWLRELEGADRNSGAVAAARREAA